MRHVSLFYYVQTILCCGLPLIIKKQSIGTMRTVDLVKDSQDLAEENGLWIAVILYLSWTARTAG